MKYLKKVSILFVLLFFVVCWNFSVYWQETNSWVIMNNSWNTISNQNNWETNNSSDISNSTNTDIKEETKKESVLETLEKRKEWVEKTLWINSVDEFDKKLKELTEKIQVNQADQEVKNQLITEMTNKFENISKTIDNKNNEIKELSELLNQQNSNRDELVIRKNELEKELENLNNEKNSLTRELEYEKDKLIMLQTDIWELKIYRDKYQKLVIENDQLKWKEKMVHTTVYIFSLLVYLLISWIWIKFFKNISHKSIFSVWTTFVFLTFIIVYTLIINPWFAIVFVFIASSLVIAFKEILVSLLSSILVIKKYHIWDIIEVKWTKWKITSIWPLNTFIENIYWEKISIWNHLLVTEPVKVHSDDRLREYVDVELHLNVEEFDEVFKWIVKICKNLDKNFSKHWDITYTLKEKVSWKLAVNMRIHTIQSWDLLLRIFHEYLKNRNLTNLIKEEDIVVDENWDEKEDV